MKLFFLLFCCSFLLLSASCDRQIEFDARWMVGDYQEEQIIDEYGFVISCTEPDFDQYACLHENDLNELIDILSRARLPKKNKQRALKFLRKATK